MSGVTDRRPRPTIPFDSKGLAEQSELKGQGEGEEEDEEVEFELAEHPAPHPHVVAAGTTRLATGTTPPEGVRHQAATVPMPLGEARSRTTTVHDPLTTSVLAEVARRAEAMDAAP